jgi:hypothetical protein
VVGLVVFNDYERVIARSLQLRKLVAADLLQLGHVLRLLLILLLILLCHL